MKTEFTNKDGSLTAYAFACGYVETKGEYKIYKDGVYHLQGCGVWQTFDTLTEARQALKRFTRHEHEYEVSFGNDERENGFYCVADSCEVFVRRGDTVRAL